MENHAYTDDTATARAIANIENTSYYVCNVQCPICDEICVIRYNEMDTSWGYFTSCPKCCFRGPEAYNPEMAKANHKLIRDIKDAFNVLYDFAENIVDIGDQSYFSKAELEMMSINVLEKVKSYRIKR